jgi:Skp family chaperone for outer membrane proteins
MTKELDGKMKKLMARSKREWDIKEKKWKEEQDKKPKSVDGKLTDEQVENWRRVLLRVMGPYALIASREEIQKLRDKMQNDVYKLDEERKRL